MPPAGQKRQPLQQRRPPTLFPDDRGHQVMASPRGQGSHRNSIPCHPHQMKRFSGYLFLISGLAFPCKNNAAADGPV